jgi:hypothetical protein
LQDASGEAGIPISHSQTILDPQIDHWGNLAFLYLSNKLIPVKGFSFSNLNLVNVTSNNHIHGLPPLFSHIKKPLPPSQFENWYLANK